MAKNKKGSSSSSSSSGIGIWVFFSLMYMFTSNTVQPIDKLEFLWRFFAGPINFLPI